MTMTLGQRIQTLRKEKGLSQEELGEKLGVARQSVSKWEADATIPELDKLISMSKLFGVSVGARLGIEEGEAPDRELTDRELAALEAIAKRLTPPQGEAQPQSEPAPAKKRRRWPYALAVLGVVAAGCFLMGRINSLENQLGNLQYNVSNIQNTVSREVGSISAQVRDILEDQNKVTAQMDHRIEEMDLLANTVTFTFTVTPREHREGMTAVFSAVSPDFEGVEVPATPGAGQSFSATLTCPLSDDITLSVAFTADGVTTSQVIAEEGYLWSGTLVDLWGDLQWRISASADGEVTNLWMAFVTDDGAAGEYKTAQGYQSVEAQGGTFSLWQNDALFWQQEVEDVRFQQMDIPTEGLELEVGDTLRFMANYSDTAGRQWEKCLCEMVVSEDGHSLSKVHRDQPVTAIGVPGE